MKKTLMMLSILAVMSAALNVQASTDVNSDSNAQEVAACTNGFDSVDVCKLLS